MSKKFTSLLLVSSMLLGTFLLGSCGKDGADSRAGTDGKDGKSAYELAVENGYKGQRDGVACIACRRGRRKRKIRL